MSASRARRVSARKHWSTRWCAAVGRAFPPIFRARALLARGATGLLIALGSVASMAPAPPDLFDELHARIAAAEAKRQTVRARFVETTTSSLLVKPVVSEGTLIGEKPARMVIRYVSPERKTIVMDGSRVFVSRPGQPVEQADVVEIMKTVNKYFTNANPGQLRRAFTVRAFLDPSMPCCYQMDLLPKRKEIKQGLQRLQLWVLRDAYMLSRMTITFAGGDTTDFTLENVELNVPIPPQTFDPPAPPAKR
jgi:outer membrane lipoprotein-sorting protein